MAPTVQTQMPRPVRCRVYVLNLQRRFRLQNNSYGGSQKQNSIHQIRSCFRQVSFRPYASSGRKHPIRCYPPYTPHALASRPAMRRSWDHQRRQANELVPLSATIIRRGEAGRMVTSGCVPYSARNCTEVQTFKLQVVCQGEQLGLGLRRTTGQTRVQPVEVQLKCVCYHETL